MTKWLQFLVLYYLFGNPLVAIVVLVVLWWGVDRVAFGLLPDPLRWWRRRARVSRLRALLDQNPHDRRARLELADLLVGRRSYGEALEVLTPNVAAGDDDAETLFVLGVAAFGAGKADQAEVFLAGARTADPRFRLGAIDLELGRWRLLRGDAKGAIGPLEAFCATRVGSVEGKVLLAKAREATGDAAVAAKLRDEAWKDHVANPRFQRRESRWWAWRAKPARPLSYVAIAAVVGLTFSLLAGPAIVRALERPPTIDAPPDEEGWD